MMNAKQKKAIEIATRQSIVDNIAKLCAKRDAIKSNSNNTEVIKTVGVMIAQGKL